MRCAGREVAQAFSTGRALLPIFPGCGTGMDSGGNLRSLTARFSGKPAGVESSERLMRRWRTTATLWRVRGRSFLTLR